MSTFPLEVSRFILKVVCINAIVMPWLAPKAPSPTTPTPSTTIGPERVYPSPSASLSLLSLRAAKHRSPYDPSSSA